MSDAVSPRLLAMMLDILISNRTSNSAPTPAKRILRFIEEIFGMQWQATVANEVMRRGDVDDGYVDDFLKFIALADGVVIDDLDTKLIEWSQTKG